MYTTVYIIIDATLPNTKISSYLHPRAFRKQLRSIAGILSLFGRGWHGCKYEKRGRAVESFGDSHAHSRTSL